MASNGKEIVDYLCDMFPRHGLDDRQREVWGRGLAKEHWETKVAIEAVKVMLKGRPTDFLPSFPSVESSISAHHRRVAEAKSPKAWKEEPVRGEAAGQVERARAMIAEILAKARVIKHPGWGTAEFTVMRSWRSLNGVPAPVGPEQRAQREKLPPELIEEERNLYRAICAGVRARR
jgi:hypothetical protein